MELEPKIVIKSQHSSLENFNSHFLFEDAIETNFNNACDQSVGPIKSKLQDLKNEHISLSSLRATLENSEHLTAIERISLNLDHNMASSINDSFQPSLYYGMHYFLYPDVFLNYIIVNDDHFNL